jgi:hypothetical protein
MRCIIHVFSQQIMLRVVTPDTCCFQGNYSDLLVSLSTVHSKLRGDASGQKNEDAAQVCVRMRACVCTLQPAQ